MSALSTIAVARPSLTVRFGGSPAQIAILVGVALFLIAFMIVPILRVIVVAFTAPEGGFTLIHFSDFLDNALLRDSFWNSIYVAAMTVVVASLIAVPLATIIARFNFRGAALIHTLGVVPLVMPPFVGAVAMQLIYGRNGSINLLLNEWFGFRIPFMEGLNGVIFVEALHYFPFILLNLSASLSNIDSAMEESAQNLGAHGFTLFRRIVFPLALPGYVAGAALVFVKVFDDLATPLLLNVTNMLAPQAYLKITSVGITDPMGYVISVIMIICSLGAMALAGLTLRGRDFSTQQRGGGGLSRRSMGRAGNIVAGGFIVFILLLVLSPHIGILLLSLATVWSYAVLPDGFTLAHYYSVFRESGSLISNTILYCGLAGLIDVVLGASLAYVGVDAVYFSTVLIPVKKSLEEDWFDSTEAIRIGPRTDVNTMPVRFTNVSCRLTRKPVALAPGQAQKDAYVVFIGPKRPELLAQYQAANDPNYSLKDIIYYGMWPFGAVARGMLSVLHFFYGIVGNFGIAIIMLTVVVRGAMFPISFKQTQNMARMQALKPELDRINEKYKTDMQKRSAAMQELYRKNKINPLGGCLPVFLQLPVFIGLYRSIMIDVELRQRPLFTDAIRWCSDLSAPDMLFDWSWLMPQFINNGEGIFGLGPYFNVLPLVTIVLFLVSMKMSMPEPTNEQGVMQQKMMKYMTVFMGLLFYKVASGLCLYFIASSLWGLGERRLLKKAKQDGGPGGSGQTVAKKAVPPTREQSSGSSNGSPGTKKSKEKRKR